MKRYAILLGCSDGLLSTPLDLSRMKQFLMSNKGGVWFESEIFCKTNIRYSSLIPLLTQVKNEKYDYLLIYFSGHGGYKRDTIIELNPNQERIEERYLSNLACRQLNIFDCCRVREEIMTEDSKEVRKTFSSVWEVSSLRKKYEERIMKAAPQQMSIYSCSVGESSYDFGKGGIFTTSLLDTVRESKDEFLLVSQAFVGAKQITINEALKHNVRQTPDYFMAKIPFSQQLILAVNNFNVRYL